jgi:peptidyl-tRNA hydrolase
LDDSGKYQSCKFDLDGKQIMVVIPMTSMNNSGQGLKTFLLENELKDYELFVVHDDIDLGLESRKVVQMVGTMESNL